MKKILTLLVILSFCIFASSQSCPISHNITETATNSYDLVFNSVPENQNAEIDTTGNGLYDITATYVSGTTFSLTVSGNPIFYNIRFGSSICSYGQSLPIELVSFDANLGAKGKINVSWITAEELNNEYFNVLNNGITVMTYAGRGTYQGITEYDVTIDAKEGYNYIQLKQVDFDGKFTLSNTVSVLYIGETAQKFYFDLTGRNNGRFYVQGREKYYLIDENR